MKVSIICASDRPERLPLLFWSLVAQTYTDWELIVLDQSGDERGVDRMITVVPADTLHKVHIVKCDRLGDWGQTVKEKAALSRASGDVLIFPADDAYYVPTALGEFVRVIEAGADIAICGWLYNIMGYCSMPPSTKVGYVDVGGFMVTRDMFCRAGWADKSQTGDAKFLESCIQAGARVGITHGVLYVKN